MAALAGDVGQHGHTAGVVLVIGGVEPTGRGATRLVTDRGQLLLLSSRCTWSHPHRTTRTGKLAAVRKGFSEYSAQPEWDVRRGPFRCTVPPGG
ncbi:hypothetical protein Ae406Ps2_5696 [Pseudonocardia sp. Ae406_Ps2]|nr:hypothetical protein Ae406Ps2_5696 [Pseudonocardia sp. Ae406_Ps2]OLM15147.1 hypothetical protein Ae505Ps2_5279c [Pseudonocardia sp. Ae505_Ps2]